MFRRTYISIVVLSTLLWVPGVRSESIGQPHRQPLLGEAGVFVYADRRHRPLLIRLRWAARPNARQIERAYKRTKSGLFAAFECQLSSALRLTHCAAVGQFDKPDPSAVERLRPLLRSYRVEAGVIPAGAEGKVKIDLRVSKPDDPYVCPQMFCVQEPPAPPPPPPPSAKQ